MALPDHLERLKHISIDTLDLPESTQAFLKWYGITHVLDCIAFFYRLAHERNASRPWSRLFGLMFDEVKPALMAAGYWDLVLDAEVWHALKRHRYIRGRLDRKIVHWQGKDQNLYKIPLDRLGLADVPALAKRYIGSIGKCLNHFIHALRNDPEYWAEIDQNNDHYKEAVPEYGLNDYLWGVMQPRLVKLDLWAFVEEHIDDVDGGANWDDFELDDVLDGDGSWGPFEMADDPPFHMVLLQWLLMPIVALIIGGQWIAQAMRALQESRKR
jgi:hypothetical protein